MSCCKSKLVLLTAINLGMLAGCEREQTAPARPASAPTTASAALAFAEFRVDDRPCRFEQPRVSIERDSSTPRILIYSAKESPTGSFYFEVPIQWEAVDQGDVISWEQQLQATEMQDSLIGIELASGQTLQPQSLRIEIRLLGDQAAEVSLAGDFHVYRSGNLVRTAQVQARFAAAIEKAP